MHFRNVLAAFLFLCTCVFTGCNEEIPSAVDLGSKISNNYTSHTSISYDVDYHFKPFHEANDTMKSSVYVDLVRDLGDTLMQGQFWSSSEYFDRHYNGDNFYLIYNKDSKITKFDKDEHNGLNNNGGLDYLLNYFTYPNRISRILSDTTSSINVSESTHLGEEVWEVVKKYPDDDYSKNRWLKFWVNKKTYHIVKKVFSVDDEIGQNQYMQWEYRNYTFDKVTSEDFERKLKEESKLSIIEDYVDDYVEPVALSKGSEVPPLIGNLYPSQEELSLDKYRGKVVLLDFWYMDCPPCIKAIPHLNKLYKKYKDQGLVLLGVNPIDNTEKGLKRMPKFLDKIPIDYPILFSDRESMEIQKIISYPTLYIIDRNGLLVEAVSGFHEGLENEVDKIIQEQI